MARHVLVLLALTSCTATELAAPPQGVPDGAGMRFGDAAMWVGFRDLHGVEATEDPCTAFEVDGACLDALAWARGG